MEDFPSRERFLWTQFLQRLYKILSCLLPITLTQLAHLQIVHLGHTHWRLLFLVCLENSSLFNPEHFKWCQTLQVLQHMLSIFPTFVLHFLHFRGSIFLLIGEGYEGFTKSVLQHLAVLALVNIELITNFLALIYLDCSCLLFLPT